MKQVKLLALFLLTVMAVQAQEKTIQLVKGRFPLKAIFNLVQQEQPITLFYSDDIVRDDMHYTVTKDRMSIESLLQEALPPLKLAYKKIADNMIIVHAQINDQRGKHDRLTGTIVDDYGHPVTFATIRLLLGDQLLALSNTIEDGSYSIRKTLQQGTTYQIQINSLSHKSFSHTFQYPDTAAISRIVLQQQAKRLQTVHVTAQVPPFSRIADRLIVNVEGTMLESGLSTLEILQQSPGLWVDANGNIKIRGNQSVRVMINDILQRMSSEQLAEYLRSLPSENIKKIEIIPNPGAEYEAEGTGGIVRIILKKNINDGFKANLLARYLQQRRDPYLNTGAILDFKKNKFYITAVGAYLKDNRSIISNYDVSYPDQSNYLSSTDRTRYLDSYNSRITASYDITDNQNVSIQTLWIGNTIDQVFNTQNTHLLSNQTLRKQTANNWDTRQNMLNSTLNYNISLDSVGTSVKVIADYLSNKHRESNDYTMRSVDTDETERYINLSPSLTEIYSLQSDFTRYYSSTPFNWIAGAKFVGTNRYNEVLRNNNIDGQWIKDPRLSNEFQYRENLFMAYGAINYKRYKTSVKIGLRAEQTYINALSITNGDRINQSYISLFPSIYLLQEVGAKKHSLYLNYAKRLRRPSFKDLNPYTLQIDDFILLEGNAGLTPEYIHKLETGFSLKNGLTADVYFAYTKDKIALFMESINNKTLAYQSHNFNSSIDYGASLFIPWNVKKWWSIQSSLAWYRTRFEYDNVDLSQQIVQANLSQTFKFKDIMDASIYLDYISPTYLANTKYADQFYSSLRISKSLLSKKAKITLMLNDIFNTAREHEITAHQGTTAYFYQKRPTQTFGMSISYSISKGKKFENKKIEQSNTDEKNRTN
ncbi:outer membrane beta-barrel family protein [Sphingobacterium sp. SYP-B4668]|uniref:outer membrane beta-barrel family protein n=1 Tax=Sphingobacterium sp. SYP-B4668 TaxID=2996035 RepID=UPI0022DE4FA3|nr:outer membrane beta-barrel family protein [Sphingobacterium sp. SYP-B4668]